MHKSLKILIMLVGFSLSHGLSIAQNSTNKNRVYVDVGVSIVTSEKIVFGHPSGEYFEQIPIALFKLKYLLTKPLSIGCYFAYSNMGHRIPLVLNSEGVYELVDSEGVVRISSNTNNFLLNSNTLFYGINANLDLLSLLTGQENLRFKLNASTEFGLVSARWNELKGIDWIMNWNGPFPEYGLGLSASYFFTKRLGLTLGYSVGRFYNNDNSRMYAGIEFKF